MIFSKRYALDFAAGITQSLASVERLLRFAMKLAPISRPSSARHFRFYKASLARYTRRTMIFYLLTIIR